MIRIKLRDEAPWREVTLLNGTVIYRRKWTTVPDDTDYVAFKKWIVVEAVVSAEPVEEVDYSIYSKAQLLAIANEKNLNIVSTLKKSEIIEAIING